MADRLYCFSDPAEPGLVRIAQWRDDGLRSGEPHDSVQCNAGESIDWSLDVERACAAIAAIDRSMRWYRKSRGRGIYRCSPKDAWTITMRHSAVRKRGRALSSFSVSDVLLTVFLSLAILSGILAMQVPAFDTAMSLSATAVLMAVLTVCLAFARDRVPE